MSAGSRWEKGQAILHTEDREKPGVANTYGSLRYMEEDRKEGKSRRKGRAGYRDRYTRGSTDLTRSRHENGRKRQGFVMEAREAPGTSLHTDREKHFSPESPKKVRCREERFLYSSELPFRNQSFFYDISEKKKSREFLECMKCMLEEQGHTTLQDAFGFLEQEPERLKRQRLEKNRLREMTLQEFHAVNRRIDDLNGRLRKKEARERQLCSQLQLMIERRSFGSAEEAVAERGKKGAADGLRGKRDPARCFE